jgi:cytochrome c peroxidase
MSARGKLTAIVVVLAAVAAAAACGGGDAGGASRPPAGDGGPDAPVKPAGLCPDGKPVEWPPGPYGLDISSTLPAELAFDAPGGAVRIADFFEPCAEKSRLLVVRTSGAWCGSCDWHVKHTKRMFDEPRIAGRFVLLDLLVSDEDNMPATLPALERFRSRIDAEGKVAIDPKYTFQKSLLSLAPLPSYVVIDTKTMQVQAALGDPDPDALHGRLSLVLASLDRAPRPDVKTPVLYDDTFTENQIDLVRGMKLVAAPPPDPTNEFADAPAAAALGKALFFDVKLSPSGTVSCATCHQADRSFTDGLPQSSGVAKVDRNSPGVALAAHARWQFWDGRADTLWMQALGPPENDKEMGSSRLFVAHQIAQRYAAEYQAAFGAKYPLPPELETDAQRFPASGKPGDAAWSAMTQADRDAVTRVYVNVGKAIAAFERSLRVKPGAIDRYADGDKTALTPAQKKALKQFLVGGCAQCHWGPRLTDDAFHAIRFSTGRQDGKPDRGRIDVLPDLAKGEFVATSKWSDAPSAAKPLALAAEPTMLGAFKTPTLRGVAVTAPYGHGGTLATILDVTKHYGKRAEDVKDGQAVGAVEPWVAPFDANVQVDMVPIFEAFDAEVVTP